jgi:hypothetical protein
MDKIVTETELEYYQSLPEGYEKMTNIKEIFKLPPEGEILTAENAEIREGIELIVYNPQTNQYYSRYLTYSSNRKNLLRYMNDGNLFIKSIDILLREPIQKILF